MKKFTHYFALAILCLGLVGCNSSNTTDDNTTGNNNNMNDNAENSEGMVDNYINRDDAEQTALGRFDGTVDNYTERFDDDEPHHLFEIVNDNDERYEVKVHRETGEIIDHRMMDDNNGNANGS